VISTTAGRLKEVRTAGIYVLDGETDDDVRAAAKTFAESHSLHLAAGPAAFVQYFAQFAHLPRSNAVSWPAIQTCLVINGSLHKRSHQQIEEAHRHGWITCDPDTISAHIRKTKWIILAPPAAITKPGLRFARQLGEMVQGILQQVELDALIVFGGDTAYGILSALGHPLLEPLGEVVPGVPLTKIKAGELTRAIAFRQRDLYIVSKAGGFGSPDILSLIRSRMTETR